jgi:uncharacterized membrane protein YfcA
MEVIWVAAVILLGTFVQGLTGFGLALVSVPLLSLMLDVKVAVPVAGLFGWMITFPLVYKMRRHVQWRTALIMVVGSLPGSWLGANLLKLMPAKWILVAMGLVLIASSLHALFKKPAAHGGKASDPLSALAGFCSGTLGASVGEPGPPVIAYSSMQPWSADQVKASLLFFFMLQMIGAIIGFWNKELLTPQVFSLFGWGIPSFLVGLLGGMKAWDLLKIHKINYHGIVHSFLFCIGSFLFVKNLFFR